MTIRSVNIPNKRAEGTNRKALAFLPLFKRGLGAGPKSLGGKKQKLEMRSEK